MVQNTEYSFQNTEYRNKAGYTAQDALSMRTFHLRKQHGTDGGTDTTSYRDATAHLKTAI